ncbi:alpha/beta fold hydrolase [Haloarcula argentinensis]|uniref:Alpha/beta hydrolase n=1 Tax=Haloarcula argentinensis TaxID=43776 RepID=A0A830F974_HALAR|nr:alpha/beta hydrolase [Haloarcula argentinensis]GGM24731.1 alpha/beta hydrolase [Haloarcula argentinensis]
MKLRKALGAVVGAVGATAAANRVLQSRAGAFEPMLDGEQGTYRWRGFDIAYTEAGDPSDPDLVLFHGINAAASSHEFHTVFDTLAEDYHVIAPDLPGFGQTDRPPLLYSASLYTAFVRDFIEDNTTDATVVASSLTGAYAASAAQEVDVKELVLVCPTDTSMGNRTVWLRSLLRAPVIGEAIYNLTVSKPSIRHFHADHGYYDMDNLTEEVVDYEWQSGHQPGARFAPASFVSGFLDPEDDLGETLAGLDVPVTLVWGEDADITPLSQGRDLAEQADAMLVVFGDSLLLPHVEHPGEFVDVVRDRVTSVTVEN